mgnify:FL=1
MLNYLKRNYLTKFARKQAPNIPDDTYQARIALLEAQLRSVFLLDHRPEQILVEPGVSPSPRHTDDTNLIQRIIRSYRIANNTNSSAGESQWSLFLNEMNKDLHHAFLSGDSGAIAHNLRNPASNNLFYGFENIRVDYCNQCRSDPGAESWYAHHIADGLVRLAEAVGAIPVDNPETYSFRQPSPIAIENILLSLGNR